MDKSRELKLLGQRIRALRIEKKNVSSKTWLENFQRSAIYL